MSASRRPDNVVTDRRMGLGVSVRVMGLLVVVWGTIIAAVGIHQFTAAGVAVTGSATDQLAQTGAVGTDLQQPLSRTRSPEDQSGVVSAQIEQQGRGWSLSVDAGAVDQVQAHNLRIIVGQLDLLQQIVPIRIQADNVQRITPVIRNERTQDEIRLPAAQEVSAGQWVHEWSVAAVPAGSYRVQIEIDPIAGDPYMAYDGNVYELPTYAAREAALEAGRDSVASMYDSLEEIRVAMEEMPARPETSTLYIPAADQARGVVQVYLDNDNVNAATLEMQSSSGTWRAVGAFLAGSEMLQRSLDTGRYGDGWYSLRAVDPDSDRVLTDMHLLRISNTPQVTQAVVDTRSIEERVRRESALTDPRVNASQVIDQADVAATADIANDIYTEANSLIVSLWPEYRQDINQFSDGLAAALRSNETQTIERAKERFRDLEADIVARLDGRRPAVITAVQQLVRNRLNERILRVEQAEAYVGLLVDRSNTGSSSAAVNALVTDPQISFYAFASTTTVVSDAEYQQPRTAGVTRDDLFQVEGIETATTTAEPVGVLRGTALPNTTIRLFIYSNPVVVTLNTNADGTWEYQFDTELEDGDHEVYVALTDGVGQVVAKSNPFQFVKTAQAFSPVDRIAAGSVSQSNQTGVNLMNWPLVYLIVSLSVVVIGFLIMVVGATLRAREDDNVVIKTKILP